MNKIKFKVLIGSLFLIFLHFIFWEFIFANYLSIEFYHAFIIITPLLLIGLIGVNASLKEILKDK